MDSSSPLIGIEVPDWKCHPPVNREKESAMKLIRVGVDLAKNVFQVHGVDRHEKAVWRRRACAESNWLQGIARDGVNPAARSAWRRAVARTTGRGKLQARGFKVRLIAPQFVKPYVKSNKNDANDAEAICEAMSRPHMRFVAVKTRGATRHPGGASHSCRADQATHGQGKPDSRPGCGVRVGGAEESCCNCAGRCRCWLEDADERLERSVSSAC